MCLIFMHYLLICSLGFFETAPVFVMSFISVPPALHSVLVRFSKLCALRFFVLHCRKRVQMLSPAAPWSCFMQLELQRCMLLGGFWFLSRWESRLVFVEVDERDVMSGCVYNVFMLASPLRNSCGDLWRACFATWRDLEVAVNVQRSVSSQEWNDKGCQAVVWVLSAKRSLLSMRPYVVKSWLFY